jgi:hypothetical protein
MIKKIPFLILCVIFLTFSCNKAGLSKNEYKFYDLESAIKRKISMVVNIVNIDGNLLEKIKNNTATATEKLTFARQLGFSNFSDVEYEFRSIQFSISKHISSQKLLVDKAYFLRNYQNVLRVTFEKNIYTNSIASPYKSVDNQMQNPLSNPLYENLSTTSDCCPCTDSYNRAMDSLFWNVFWLGSGTIIAGVATGGIAMGIAGGTLLTIAGYYANEQQNLLDCWDSCVSSGTQVCW